MLVNPASQSFSHENSIAIIYSFTLLLNFSWSLDSFYNFYEEFPKLIFVGSFQIWAPKVQLAESKLKEHKPHYF